jgi:hypothetical protein
VRTLVISDLHIGLEGDGARLEDRDAASALRVATEQADRLILLGDILELRRGPVRHALAAAQRVLPDLVQGLGPGKEIVVVPGNHDHELLSRWFDRRSIESVPEAPQPLGPASRVRWRKGEALAELAGLLGSGGAKVTASYPGVWLREDVYATHGHYLDCVTTVPAFERLAAGAMGRLLGRPVAELTAVDDYEAALSPIYAWMYASAQVTQNPREQDGSDRIWYRIREAQGLKRIAWEAAVLAVVAGLNAAGIGPVKPELTGVEFRRAGLLAFGSVLESLGVGASYAIFGHTHRAGPLPGDDHGEWRGPTGARIFNSGCWVNMPTYTDDDPTSPYRAGFAIWLDDDGGPPRLVNLLVDPQRSGSALDTPVQG